MTTTRTDVPLATKTCTHCAGKGKLPIFSPDGTTCGEIACSACEGLGRVAHVPLHMVELTTAELAALRVVCKRHLRRQKTATGTMLAQHVEAALKVLKEVPA